MKKLLYTLIVFTSLISCSVDKIDYTEQEIVVNKYNRAFVEKFGEPSPTQTWGFNQTRAAYTNSNMWSGEGYEIPDNVSSSEIEDVLEEFNKKGKSSYESLVNWDCFFVQHIYGAHSNMDYLCAYDPEGHKEIVYIEEYNWQPHEVVSYDDHINNFNASNGSIMLMLNSSTQRFGFRSSEDSKMHYNFRMEKINENYYVGIDYEANGKRDYVYNDWIIKITPGKDIPDNIKEAGIIICEDLGTIGDFDFNDVVFYAKVWESGRTDIDILAAGGKFDITVAEVNVGEVMGKMVNTGLKTVPSYSFTSKNTYNSLIDIPVIVSKTDVAGNVTSYELTAQMGKAPQKICVPVGFKWTKEYKSLVDAYPGFKNWTTGKSDTWCGEYNSDLVVN